MTILENRVSVFVEFWIAEFESKCREQGFKFEVLKSDNLKMPHTSVNETFENVFALIEDGKSVILTDSKSQGILHVYKTKRSLADLSMVNCFYELDSLLKGEEESLENTDYLDKILTKAGVDSVCSRKGELVIFGDTLFEIGKKTKRERLVIGTPIFKRHAVLEMFLTFVCEYLIPSLKWENFDVVFLLVGDEEDASFVESLGYKDTVLFRMENNLGKKKNKILDLSRGLQADYLAYLDSDDLFHPQTILKLIKLAKKNGYWSAVKNFGFYDTSCQKEFVFDGYGVSHSLGGQGMGSGRIFTKKLMGCLGESPFAERNQKMDESVKDVLRSLDIEEDERLLVENYNIPVGVKTSLNIWGISNYPVEENPEGSKLFYWMPLYVLQKIELLEFD